MCTPGDDLPKVDDWFDTIYGDKWIHIIMFGLLAHLFMRPFQRSILNNREKLHYFIRIALTASVWGLVIEFIQKYWILNRSFDMFDWLADSVGAAIALLYNKKTLK